MHKISQKKNVSKVLVRMAKKFYLTEKFTAVSSFPCRIVRSLNCVCCGIRHFHLVKKNSIRIKQTIKFLFHYNSTLLLFFKVGMIVIPCKLSCNKTALKRCTKTEILWNRYLVSLATTVLMEILLPRSARRWRADGLNRNWLKDVTGDKVNILLPWSCHLCCCTCLMRCSVNVWLSQWACYYYCYYYHQSPSSSLSLSLLYFITSALRTTIIFFGVKLLYVMPIPERWTFRRIVGLLTDCVLFQSLNNPRSRSGGLMVNRINRAKWNI